MAVRWLGVEVPVVRAFPNLVIMVVMVAASAGLTQSGRDSTLPLSAKYIAVLLTSLSALVLLLVFAEPLGFANLSIRIDQSHSWFACLLPLLVLLLFVICLYILFRHLGILLGKEFVKLPPLSAYSVNLLGSIAGVITFGLISWMSLAPWVWLAICGLISFILYKKPISLATTIMLVALAFFTTHESRWSPYSKLDVVPLAWDNKGLLGAGNYYLNSNNQYFHFGLRILDPIKEREYLNAKDNTPQAQTVKHYYKWLRIPISCAPKHDKILVLGAGSGNDVAFALMNGAKQIDAVEIDPIISTFGYTIHPNKPFLDPKVKVFTEDARTFLRYSPNKYDLIEFAYLDPGATVRIASFLRIDNYVYTKEAIKAAIRHLNENGVISVTFATGANSIITRRLYQTISSVLGAPPITYVDDSKWDSVLFLFGPGTKNFHLSGAIANELRPWPQNGEMSTAEPITDQWPFLYLDYNISGIWLYILVLTVAVLLPGIMLTFAKQGAISPASWGNMFFLGQAFMLIETKSITQLSLLFGATWLVSSIVISTVLTLAWLANLVIRKFPQTKLVYLYAGLLISLTIDYLWRVPDNITMSPLIIATVASLLACLPIFFGSMIFSSCFNKVEKTADSLAANLLGVSIGGLTESLCIVTGIKGLALVAMALYGLSYLSLLVKSEQVKPQSGAE